MGDLVLGQLKDVLDAYAQKDTAKALDVWKRDGAIDALYTSLFRELLTYMMEDPRNISFCTHLLFCAKNIERIGDHTTNIAETVHYLVTAETLAIDRPKDDRSIDTTMATGSLTMGPRVLIVEDEEPLMLLLRYNLEAEGYDVDGVSRGDEAEIRLREQVPDIVLLDWMLPGLSGIELCRRIRARTETERLPVIMLTARGRRRRPHPRPFHGRGRLHRQALLGAGTAGARACAPAPGEADPYRNASPGRRHRARPRDTPRPPRSGQELHLGPTEFRLLEFLMQSPGRVFSREHLLNAVWGHDVYIDERTVDVHVGRLRKAINLPRQPDPIRTVRGAGYSFDETFAREEQALEA